VTFTGEQTPCGGQRCEMELRMADKTKGKEKNKGKKQCARVKC
jgi:hypothetical protein